MAIINMFGTLQFWIYATAIFWNALALYNGWKWLVGKYRQWQHQRMLNMLKLRPSALNSQIKKLNQALGAYEDELLVVKNERDEAKRRGEELAREVRLLVKRNMFAANELRCDDGKETQVLVPVRSGRWR